MTLYKKLIAASVLFLFILVLWLTYTHQDTGEPTREMISGEDSVASTTELMTLVVYRQNQTEAAIRDCGITYGETIEVQKTTVVADASLIYLFSDELVRYGEFQSVVIENGVAKVTINNPADPTGLYIYSLSSCESQHLLSVLEDTLIQYDTVKSVELYTSSGKIEF